MSRRATPLLVDDIWEAIEKVERYRSGLKHNDFISDDKTVDSVVRTWKSSEKPPAVYQKHSEANISKSNGAKLSA